MRWQCEECGTLGGSVTFVPKVQKPKPDYRGEDSKFGYCVKCQKNTWQMAVDEKDEPNQRSS